ncbi:MAG: DNA repair protein RecN [Alphaproteobacteria bacterium]|nr:DNA repair protein RecN [Alphaproteobacteria bacterium]
MLAALSVRNVVLIEALDLEFGPGLHVLTGETGAGKSLLLDALGLAVGARGDRALIGPWGERAQVSALFTVPRGHPARALLAEQGLDAGEAGEIILRRQLGADGRTRAFVNDELVSLAFLEALGEGLLEIHGQRANLALLKPARHRAALDACGALEPLAGEVSGAFARWRGTRERLDTLRAQMAEREAELAHLDASLAEIEALKPEPGEETALVALRAGQSRAERVAAELADALKTLGEDAGLDKRLNGVLRRLERLEAEAPGSLREPIAALERALIEAREAEARLAEAAARSSFDAGALERAEERLFALRAVARKHRVTPDALSALGDRLRADRGSLATMEEDLRRLERETGAAREAYLVAARALSARRALAAAALDAAVASELSPLKLGGARFRTRIDALGEDEGAAHGLDAVRFEVATNAGHPFGPIDAIASGGELARFALALKVALEAGAPARTLVFDEVDNGVGGAVADAVGERLARLAGASGQVFVVTHAPQVAARGRVHLKVEKGAGAGGTVTRLAELGEDERREEVARMLAGAEVTDEARAAAARLLRAGTKRSRARAAG